MIPFHFHAAAEAELSEVAAFYEARLVGLKESFIAEVDRGITIIRQYPDAGAPLGPLLRKFNLRRFPYAIVYHYNQRTIQIMAIAHQKRRPGYWRDRMPTAKFQ